MRYLCARTGDHAWLSLDRWIDHCTARRSSVISADCRDPKIRWSPSHRELDFVECRLESGSLVQVVALKGRFEAYITYNVCNVMITLGAAGTAASIAQQ